MFDTKESWFCSVQAYCSRNWKWLLGGLLSLLFVPQMVHFGNVDADKRAADQAINNFHKHFNEAAFNAIYDEADPVFQQHMSREDWISWINESKSRYGMVRQASCKDVRVFVETPLRVRAVCDSHFDKEDGHEIFAFLKTDEELHLSAYGLVPWKDWDNH